MELYPQFRVLVSWGGGVSYLQVGAQRQPHLDVLHLLQSKMRDFRLAGSAGRRQVAEEFGEQQSLKQTCTG